MNHRKRPYYPQTRRQFLKQSAVLASAGPLAGTVPFRTFSPATQGQHDVNLNWLGTHAPKTKRGVTWGVPWAEGVLQSAETLNLATNGGTSVNT